MVYKHTVVAAFHIYAQRGEDAAKRGGLRGSLNSHGNYIVDHGKIIEKSWNCVFEFMWEPCTLFSCILGCYVKEKAV